MNAFLIIVGINTATLGAAFLFGGIFALGAPSDAENEDLRRRYQIARDKSWVHAVLFSFSHAAEARVSWPRLLAKHWPERPGGRKLVYCGALFLVIAVAIGLHFGVFNS